MQSRPSQAPAARRTPEDPACTHRCQRLSPAQGRLRHGVSRVRLRVRIARQGRPAPASAASARRRLLAALADSGDVAMACRVAGVSRGRLLALLAEDADFQARWAGLSGARMQLLDWVLANRALAALESVPDKAAAPDKAAVALAQWVIDQRGRPRTGAPAAERPGGPARAGRRAAERAEARADGGAAGEPDDEAEIAALIETIRARIEAAEADIEAAGGPGAP